MNDTKNPVIVIGHKNPDTDSVCSAIAYAHLQNAIYGGGYLAARAGTLSNETAFVLNKFEVNDAKLMLDIQPRVADLETRDIEPVKKDTSLRKAWALMRDYDVHRLAVTDDDDKIAVVITLQEVARADMDSLGQNDLSQDPIPVKNLLVELKGRLVCGDEDALLDKGKVVIAAGTEDTVEEGVKDRDVVLVSDRIENQIAALGAGASCLIVCLTDYVDGSVVAEAKEKGATIIATPYPTFKASRLISQSVPVSCFMFTDFETFTLDAKLDDVKEIMKKVRHNHFPVVDKKGRYLSLVSKRNLLNYNHRQLVLVDHNEKSQCVDGFELAKILGIIDHHRLGDIETSGPIFFRNQPVGCTATIIKQMYEEAGVAIPSDIAGIMCCAILSDTLAFRSPTCTEVDKKAAEELARIAGVEIMSLAEEMFEAGENLSGRSGSELFNTDCKVLRAKGHKIVISQGAFYTKKNLGLATEMVRTCIEAEMQRKGCDMAFFLATSITESSSQVLSAGDGAGELLNAAFGAELSPDGSAWLPGVVSRKKQFVPGVLEGVG